MKHSELIRTVVERAPFPRESDAQGALLITLETLGYVLPERLVHALEGALPQVCAAPLRLGLSVSRDQRLSRGSPHLEPGPLPPVLRERVQATCRALGSVLSPDLLGDIERELPAALKGAFSVPARAATTHVRGDSASSGARHLSQAAPGSAHPLSSSAPKAAHSHSVAEANPHADTKLSSARGTTQEREASSLASARGARNPDRS